MYYVFERGMDRGADGGRGVGEIEGPAGRGGVGEIAREMRVV